MYNKFSKFYDSLIDTDYNRFVEYYKSIFKKYSVSPKLIADLGCGTGTLTDLMHKQGFDMIGIDCSPQMLDIAKNKNQDILYINQDMTEFELYGTVDVIYSSLDCINYIQDENLVKKVFSLVNNYLNYGGLYIFDISSFHKLSVTLGNNTFVFDDDDIFYTWENFFEDDFLTMNLTFFEKCGNLYKRFNEDQVQRAYKISDIVELAKTAGLEILGVFDEFTFDEPSEKSERIFFVLRRRNQ